MANDIRQGFWYRTDHAWSGRIDRMKLEAAPPEAVVAREAAFQMAAIGLTVAIIAVTGVLIAVSGIPADSQVTLNTSDAYRAAHWADPPEAWAVSGRFLLAQLLGGIALTGVGMIVAGFIAEHRWRAWAKTVRVEIKAESERSE